jgi:hypothetical protein
MDMSDRLQKGRAFRYVPDLSISTGAAVSLDPYSCLAGCLLVPDKLRALFLSLDSIVCSPSYV